MRLPPPTENSSSSPAGSLRTGSSCMCRRWAVRAITAEKFSRDPATRSAMATAASLADTMSRAWRTSSNFHVWPIFMFMLRAGMP